MVAIARKERVLVDGANIDGVLGQILRRRPLAYERPRRDVVKRHFHLSLGIDCGCCFPLDKARFNRHVYPLYRALHGMGYFVPVAAFAGTYPNNDDAVDEYILTDLETVLYQQRLGRPQSVAVLSHDHIYAPALTDILLAGGDVIVCGFEEWFHPALLDLETAGARIIDLEREVGGFSVPLPRP